jgi:uncharacterized protein YkwD
VCLFLFIGCGSSSDSDNPTNQIDISGTAVDGYIKDAKVCIDINNNNLCDSSEPSTNTDTNGKFTFTNLDISLDGKQILMIGGVDTATNTVFNGILKNTIDITKNINITPLTTLVQDLVSSSNQDLSSAKQSIAQSLNLDIDILYNDPMQNIELFKQTQKVIQIVKLIQDDVNTTDKSGLFSDLMSKVATSLDNSSSLDTQQIIDDISNSQFDNQTITISSDLNSSINNIISSIDSRVITSIADLASIQKDIEQSTTTIIDRLNQLRKDSGLSELYINTLLTQSATNHTNYLVANNLSGHYEDSNLSGYTGYAPVDRTMYVGYKSRSVSENLSVGQATEQQSLDGLMSAIYHRFGFLDLNIDEIGYDNNATTYVYNMGNSYLNNLCNDANYTDSGAYYYNVCADGSFRVESSKYLTQNNILIDNNPSYIIYPYKDETNIQPVFFEESPDPLPNYSVSGYPISIEFNSNDFNMSKMTIDSFTLEDSNGNSLELIEQNDSNTIMSKANDFNLHFKDTQFAIFPKYRLDFNSTYSANIDYTYDSVAKNINWQFTTTDVSNLVIFNNSDIDINLDKSYTIYFPPVDSSDVIATYSISCSYTSGGSVTPNIDVYDKNTLIINISGEDVNSCDISLNGSNKVTLNIQ